MISKDESRPGSAITDHSSNFSNSLARTYKPSQPLDSQDQSDFNVTMRSSFYSTNNNGFNKDKKNVVDSIGIKNVLEFTK